jgi:hypothetical protein
MPRPGRIEVELLPQIAAPTAGDEASVASVRRQARAAILARLGEPDLAPEA